METLGAAPPPRMTSSGTARPTEVVNPSRQYAFFEIPSAVYNPSITRTSLSQPHLFTTTSTVNNSQQIRLGNNMSKSFRMSIRMQAAARLSKHTTPDESLASATRNNVKQPYKQQIQSTHQFPSKRRTERVAT
ncbi:hypothetical protein GOBAR_DD31768 [Gossypium barbadense]|nr:hypothetical protein GOBAR_DD31768 [Gossypium barbadense]